MPGAKMVRVRGGIKGFRMIALEDWKAENLERKGKKISPGNQNRSAAARNAERKRKRKRNL